MKLIVAIVGLASVVGAAQGPYNETDALIFAYYSAAATCSEAAVMSWQVSRPRASGHWEPCGVNFDGASLALITRHAHRRGSTCGAGIDVTRRRVV